MEMHFKLIGALLMALACIHVIFPKYFNWKEELPRLSLINRQMMTYHTFFIALAVFLMGLLCFTSGQELETTPFGRRISLGLGIFWGLRMLVQFFGYSSQLWKGKAFETTVHIAFSLFWVYMSSVMMWTALK